MTDSLTKGQLCQGSWEGQSSPVHLTSCVTLAGQLTFLGLLNPAQSTHAPSASDFCVHTGLHQLCQDHLRT